MWPVVLIFIYCTLIAGASLAGGMVRPWSG